MTPHSPFGSSIFCDDIRHEIGGKRTYVGVYQNSMIVNGGFPATLTKFCIAIDFKTRPSDPDVPLTLRVSFPGDDPDKPTVNERVNIEEVRAEMAKIPIPPHFDDPIIPLTFEFNFAPLVIREPGLIRVRALAGETEIKLGSIEVRQGAAEPSNGAPNGA